MVQIVGLATLKFEAFVLVSDWYNREFRAHTIVRCVRWLLKIFLSLQKARGGCDILRID